MIKQIIITCACASSIVACGSGTDATPDAASCPTNAPLFTESLGTQLINEWGANLYAYSPYGDLGYTDVNVGAAYFTGDQYLTDAVLLPTVSATTRVGSQEIYNYFANAFLAEGPIMDNNPESPESGGPFETLSDCGSGIISGYYNFEYASGAPTTNARYTFQFEYKSESTIATIVVESGPSVGDIINVEQAPGWYIYLQNSAALPMAEFEMLYAPNPR